MAVSDIQGVFKEYIHPELNETYEQTAELFGKIKKGTAQPVSDRASRFEIEVAPGGIGGGANFDAGPAVIGNNNLVKEALVSTIGYQFARQYSDKMNWSTDSETKAITKIATRLAQGAIKEMSMRMDAMLQGDGTGVMGIIKDTSTDVAPQYSVAAAGNPQATYWLREGEKYEIYDSALAVLRAGGPYQILQDGGILAETQDVTFNNIITGAQALDRIVVQGMVNACFNGLKYLVSDATSGTWQNITRAKPYVQARSVDAGSSKLDWALIRLSLNKIVQRMGDKKKTAKLTPYCGLPQQQNYEDAAQAISQIIRQTGPQNYDMMMGDGKVQGRDVMINIHADPTLFYWLMFDDFMRLEMKKMDFLTRNGEYIIPLYGAPVGGITGPIFAVGFWLVYQAQLALKRPPVYMSYIKNLSVPSGYVSN